MPFVETWVLALGSVGRPPSPLVAVPGPKLPAVSSAAISSVVGDATVDSVFVEFVLRASGSGTGGTRVIRL